MNDVNRINGGKDLDSGMSDLPAVAAHRHKLDRERAIAELQERHALDHVISARKSREGTHVVCGQVDCGSRIATIHCADGEPECQLVMVSGFVPIGFRGITWRMPARSLKRQRNGRKPTWRRFPKNPANKLSNDVMDDIFRLLPTAVFCPACGLVNLIADETIGKPTRVLINPLGTG